MALNITFSDLKLRQSKPDPRDYAYQPRNKELRRTVDLREWDSLVEDQSELGSCVGNAITNAYELQVKRLYPDMFKELSRLFVYYNARLLEGTTSSDAGATIRSGIKGLNKYGVCTEQLWPYKLENFDDKPTEECYVDAEPRKISTYRRIKNVTEIIDAINDNYPVVVGITLYLGFAFLNEDNYIAKKEYEANFFGYHAVTIVGYNLDKKEFVVKNSFGNNWGLNGYFIMPFEYAETELFEAWIFDIPIQTSKILVE